MTKISFCGISGSGMSALAQIRLHQGYEVRGSDRSFDQGKDQSNKQALEKLGIKIYPQDGSAITDDLDVLYVSTAVEDTIPDVKAALGKNIPIRKRSSLLARLSRLRSQHRRRRNQRQNHRTAMSAIFSTVSDKSPV